MMAHRADHHLLIVLHKDHPTRTENSFDLRRALDIIPKDAEVTITLAFKCTSSPQCPRHSERRRRHHCPACVPWIVPECDDARYMGIQEVLEQLGRRCTSLAFPLTRQIPEYILKSPASNWPMLEEVKVYGYDESVADISLHTAGIWQAEALTNLFYKAGRLASTTGISMADNVNWERITVAKIFEPAEVPVEGYLSAFNHLPDTARRIITKATNLRVFWGELLDDTLSIPRQPDAPIVDFRTSRAGAEFPIVVNTSMRELSLLYHLPWHAPDTAQFFVGLNLPNLTHLRILVNSFVSPEGATPMLSFATSVASTLEHLELIGAMFPHDMMLKILRGASHLTNLRLGAGDQSVPYDYDDKEAGRPVTAHVCDGVHICDTFLQLLQSSVSPRLESLRLIQPHVSSDGVVAFLKSRAGIMKYVEIRGWAAVDGYELGAFQRELWAEHQVEFMGTSCRLTERRGPVRARGHRITAPWMEVIRAAHGAKRPWDPEMSSPPIPSYDSSRSVSPWPAVSDDDSAGWGVPLSYVGKKDGSSEGWGL